MAGALRSIWTEPRPGPVPRRGRWDWVLLAGTVVAMVGEGLLRPDLPWRLFAVLVGVALAPTLLWRRTHPLLMVAIAFGFCGLAPVLTGADLGLNTMAYLVILPYSVYRWGSGREAVIGTTVVYAKLGLSVAFGTLDLSGGVAGCIVLGAVMALGAAVRYRSRARQRELDQVKLLERERLARDLHDTVAHHVSAMAIRAQAGLAMAPTQPGAAADALRVIEAEATRALAEMRAMVRVLRRDEPAGLVEWAVTTGPRIDDLDRLAGLFRGGPTVHVEVQGELADVPAPVGAAIYRLAQESITNARRHARHATRIDVRVVADGAAVRLKVSDDGDRGSIRPAGAGGYGLIGMKERAGLLGGTCEAGPGPDRGWTVTAELPRTGAAP